MTEKVIAVALQRKYVDLGSVMIRTSCFRSTGVRFLPLSIFTQDLLTRDILTISGVLSGIQNETRQTKLIHRVLSSTNNSQMHHPSLRNQALGYPRLASK